MNVLVCPPTLSIGGSQQNAIDLGAAIAERGHEVTILAPPGPLEHVVEARGMRMVPLDLRGRSRPAIHAMRAMRRIVRREDVDVVHAYESAAGIEAFFGGEVALGVPTVVSVMSMTVPRRFPRSVPIIVGTELLRRECARRRHRSVMVLEPPIDTRRDRPSVDGGAFRIAHGLEDDELVLVVVSRLARQLKLEGLEMTIDAMSTLANELPARLFIVGDGPEFSLLAARAQDVNRRVGRAAVVLVGATVDPVPAYASADVVLGMGGSILRGMAFGKPAVVLGGNGFWRIVTPRTVDLFLDQGFYGIGHGRDVEGFASSLTELARDADMRRALGEFAARLVRDRFSLTGAAATLERFYLEARRRPMRPPVGEVARVGAWVAGFKTKQRLARVLG
jgi:glycosyltransferase involved in cell wall biosynthesis